jgi:hypothetical protein
MQQSQQKYLWQNMSVPPAPINPSRIEVRVRNLNQLFNSLDPAPFYEQDLDTDAEEFIVGWARELPRKVPFEIVLHLTEPRTDGLSHVKVEEKIGEGVLRYFQNRSRQEDRRLAELLRVGRASLLIGVIFLVSCFLVANFIGNFISDPTTPTLLHILRESFIIIGWVAMWRPLEIFLYDWWPIAGARTLYHRLSEANFQLVERGA